MSHWYRETKSVKLLDCLEQAGIRLTLNSAEFTEDDLLKLKAELHPTALRDGLSCGSTAYGSPRRALIIAPVQPVHSDWLRNPAPWAGIIVIPAHSPDRDQALASFFNTNRSYRNGARGRRVMERGVLQRFILDMRAQPPTLNGVRKISPPASHNGA
jgi:hypothetical protein